MVCGCELVSGAIHPDPLWSDFSDSRYRERVKLPPWPLNYNTQCPKLLPQLCQIMCALLNLETLIKAWLFFWRDFFGSWYRERGQTAPRIIKLLLEMPKTLTKALSEYACLGADVFKKAGLSILGQTIRLYPAMPKNITEALSKYACLGADMLKKAGLAILGQTIRLYPAVSKTITEALSYMYFEPRYVRAGGGHISLK